jgi:hypothetical protein
MEPRKTASFLAATYLLVGPGLARSVHWGVDFNTASLANILLITNYGGGPKGIFPKEPFKKINH